MKHVRIFLFLSLFSLAGRITAEEKAASLVELIQMAKNRNPDIKAAYQKWLVTKQEIGTASSWPNPNFSYVDEKDPSGMAGVEPMTRKHYSVEQEFPFPGKLGNESRMKHHEALITEAKYQDTVLDVKKRLKLNFYRASSTDKLIGLLKKNTSSFRSALSAAQARVASNQASASDVFMIQTELHQMENMLFEKEQQRKQVDIEINALLDEPFNTAWSFTSQLALKPLPLSADELEALAAEENPLYLSAAHEVNHARAMLARSRLDFAPDIGVMYEYQTADDGSGGGPAGRMLGLSLSVPLWLRRPLAFKAGAQAHLVEAEAMAKSMKNMVRKMVRMEENETTIHFTLAHNLETNILPTAQAAMDTTRDQYIAGRGDFLRMLEAIRSWIAVNRDFQNELYHYAEHWSEVERWVGVDLDELERGDRHAQ